MQHRDPDKLQNKFILVVQAQIHEAREAEWATAELLVAMVYDGWLPDLSFLVIRILAAEQGICFPLQVYGLLDHEDNLYLLSQTHYDRLLIKVYREPLFILGNHQSWYSMMIWLPNGISTVVAG